LNATTPPLGFFPRLLPTAAPTATAFSPATAATSLCRSALRAPRQFPNTQILRISQRERRAKRFVHGLERRDDRRRLDLRPAVDVLRRDVLLTRRPILDRRRPRVPPPARAEIGAPAS
jgi:hypothetical protein